MTDIFISYSHQDEKWKDALQKQLRMLQLHADFTVWDDRQIEVGDTWLPRIEEAIAAAKVATKDNEPLSRHAWDSYALKHGFSQVALKVYHLLQESRLAATETKPVKAAKPQLQTELLKSRAPSRPQAALDVQQVNFGSNAPLKLSKWALLLAGLGLAAWGVSTYRSAPVQPEPLPQEPVSLAPTALATATPEPSKVNTKFPNMLPIPAGEFTMGCVEQRDKVEGGCFDWEKPSHQVNLSAFKLAETEVTVEQYLTCVQQGGCPASEWNEKGSDYNISTGKDDYYKKMGEALTDPQYPIVGVSWENAVAYTTWLNKSQQPSQPFRLPTEAEWEYAARGGDNEQAYPWGNAIGKNKANCSDCGDKFEYTAPVGSFAPNGFGLKDMHGNVWEWVADWYVDYSAQPVSNPKGASKGSYRVLRGGSWSNSPGGLRSANRNYSSPAERNNGTGFRVAQDQ